MQDKSQHSLFVIDETTVDLAASQRTPTDEGVGSRQPNAAAIVPLASFRQGSEPPNTDDPGDHEATEATGRLTSRKRPLGRTERGEYQPSEDSAEDTAGTSKRLRSRDGGVVDVSQTQHKNGGSPQNAVNKRRQMQNGWSNRIMSPRVGRKRTEPLAVLVNRIGHIDMTRQMHKAVHVMTARPTRPVPLIRVFRHSQPGWLTSSQISRKGSKIVRYIRRSHASTTAWLS